MGRITLSKRTTPWLARVRAAKTWQAHLAVGVCAIVVYFLLPAGSLAQALIFTGAAAASAAVILAGVRRYRPVDARPWLLLAVSLNLWFAGSVI